MALGEYVGYARALFHSDLPWPSNLSMPQADAPLSTSDGRIINICLGALSWIMLHEIGHVHRGDQKLVPPALGIRQEFLADKFATKWILDGAGKGLQREFRVLMISIALTWLFLFEAEMGRGSTHPPALLRFREAVSQFRVGQRSVGLENATTLFKVVLDPTTTPPVVDTAEEAFDWICQRLESIFRV
jgi:hypothetical protein